MEKERITVTVLGYELGTSSGWDDVGDYVLAFYDFKPTIKGLKAHIPVNNNLPQLQVDLENGRIDVFYNNSPGTTLEFKDIIK